MDIPLLRVDHVGGYDLLKTDGTLDFDGGSLLVWKDNKRKHLLAGYGPSSGWVCFWTETGGGSDGRDPIRIE